MRLVAIVSLLLAVSVTSTPAATVVVPATRDATLIEHPDGALASGSGPVVFAGRNNLADNGLRRALFFFDVDSALPPHRRIVVERAELVITNLTESNVAPGEYRVHRVLADWGEGASASAGGGGAAAMPGDATWIHAFHDAVFWMHNGGQFAGEPTARLVVSGPGVYRFESEELARDVERWANELRENFGWILIGDETRRQTVRAFGSREDPDPAVRPVLEITYRGRP